jgi:hypothetical protein
MCTHKLQRGFATDRGNYGRPREGFGAGRQGKGRGRTMARNLTWECTNKGAAENRDADQATDQEQPQDNSKWEGKSDKKDNFGEQWNNKSGLDAAETSQGNKASHENDHQTAPQHNQNRVACEICGFFNHETKDCRRLHYEICGLSNHMAYDCKKCIPWNCGPELCATQVEDQSFFFIEESIDPRMAREKENTAVVSVLFS